VPVHHDRRERVVLREHPLERAAHLRGGVAVQAGFAVQRRDAGREQELVALAQRDVEHARQPQHHRAAGLRAPALDEAHVPRRGRRLEREPELAEPADAAPAPQQLPDRAQGGHGRSV
jgi:hypothetical protein